MGKRERLIEGAKYISIEILYMMMIGTSCDFSVDFPCSLFYFPIFTLLPSE
jgi:hypothetical protein